MNNSRLTNVLIVALVVINLVLVFCMAGHKRHNRNEMYMGGKFGRHHARYWAFSGRDHFNHGSRNFHHGYRNECCRCFN